MIALVYDSITVCLRWYRRDGLALCFAGWRTASRLTPGSRATGVQIAIHKLSERGVHVPISPSRNDQSVSLQ